MNNLNQNKDTTPSINLKQNKLLLVWTIISAVFLIIVFAGSIILPMRDNLVTSANFMMNTVVTQNIYDKNGEIAKNEVISALSQFDKDFSMHIDTSYISKINQKAGIAPVKVSDEVFSLISRAVEFSEQTEGAFDITVAPLVDLWNITAENPQIPADDDIKTALNLISYKYIILDEQNKTVMLKNKGQSIDLGAVAKGEACNIVREIYEKNGIKSAFISVGGNMMVQGTDPNGKPFKIGIKDPRSDDGDIFGIISLSNTSMATSGDYERYFEKDGKRYHHILDVTTGYPANSDLTSVSVICLDGAMGDFLSTAIFLGGTANLHKYIDNPDYSIIAVDKSMNVYISSNLADKFEINEDNKNNYKLAEVLNDTKN
ncbi:MAG: FAD:protein FMN transferase [Oscillospiraceae bacterium]|nr:FAD:protein FMN transferase [Oscillospiraceae bacterium]